MFLSLNKHLVRITYPFVQLRSGTTDRVVLNIDQNRLFKKVLATEPPNLHLGLHYFI